MDWFKVGTRTGTACDGEWGVFDLGVLRYGIRGQHGGGFRGAGLISVR